MNLTSFLFKTKLKIPLAQSCHRPACFAKLFQKLKMAARIRNAGWMEDLRLKQDLEKYVRQGLKRDEILNFMERDFGEYAWSLRTLDRRMRHFDIRYTDTDVTVEEVTSAVRKELDGPGKLLGYRAMHNKIRQEYLLNVPRNLVHAVMFDLDPEGLQT